MNWLKFLKLKTLLIFFGSILIFILFSQVTNLNKYYQKFYSQLFATTQCILQDYEKKFTLSNYEIDNSIPINSTYFVEDYEYLKGSPVFAVINDECEVFLDEQMKSYIKKIPQGDLVEIIQDKDEQKYLIKSDEHKVKGWILAEFLDIPETPIANKTRLKDTQIEQYVNENGFDSDTEYFVFTDIDRQLTYILKGSFNNWKLIKTIVCATGKNTSPTTRGIFKIGERGEWFYSNRFESGAKYWVSFNSSYLFHSVSMDINQNIIDPTVGQRCSSGCVRMQVEDIQWFYENIPFGTTVFIN